MKLKRILQGALAALMSLGAAAQPAGVKIGFLTDMSSLFADIDGKNGAVAVQMAIDDFGGKVLGKPIELLTMDHQNKPDLSAAKAREWFDVQGVSMILHGSGSGGTLAVAQIAQEKKRVLFAIGAGAAAITNEQCTPYTVHYAFDTVALSRGTAEAVVAKGGKSWFFLTADYTFGHALEADAAKVILARGGTVAGSVRHPLNASDLSSFLIKAQSSGAQILGLATAGGDVLNAIRTAKDFGIDKKMQMAALIFFISDVHGLGLKNAEGLYFTTSWDWNLNEETRAFGRKFFAKTRRMPTDLQAADYSATMNYLKAVAATKTTDADTVMAYLKKTPLRDFYASGVIRPDGRYEHNMYLMQVKSPAESTAPWDYTKLVKTMAGKDVFTRKEESRCSLWKDR